MTYSTSFLGEICFGGLRQRLPDFEFGVGSLAVWIVRSIGRHREEHEEESVDDFHRWKV